VAAVRLSPTGPLVLLADHLHGEIAHPHLSRAESGGGDGGVARAGLVAESGPFGIPHGPCCTFRDPTGTRLAIYENQRPEVDREFAGRFDEA